MHSPFNRAVLLSSLLGLIAPAQAAPLSINFEPSFNDRAVQLDSLKYRSSAEEIIGYSRISLLLSGFALETENGEWVELENSQVYLDAASRRLDANLGTMPQGNFRSMRFAIGPEPSANHSDPAQYAADHPLNPILNNLLWDWQTGYIFLALEGKFQSLEKPVAGYVLHFANDWNRTWINLPVQIDGSKPTVLDIQFDLAALFNTPAPISFEKDGQTTHSRADDELAATIKRNLPSAFSLMRISVLEPANKTTERIEPKYLPRTFEPYPFKMSRSFPIPALPKDNPLTQSRVELGEKLFNDKRLSKDRSLSCASCHKTEYAFTDALTVSLGVGDAEGTRNSMPLFNLAWKSEFFWDGRSLTLREQVVQPITNKLEMASDYESVLTYLKGDDKYTDLFTKAFNPPEPTIEKLALSLEAYLLTLTSADSRFDQARKGKTSLSEEEQRGMELFFTEYDPRTEQFGADCFHCHGGPLFSDQQFHNNGLEQGPDTGRFKITAREGDLFKFSTPSLRNIGLTAPYMHDGRFLTLEEVIEHYTSPMEISPSLDPNLAKHPDTGLLLSEEDKAALVAFLKTLDDPQYSK